MFDKGYFGIGEDHSLSGIDGKLRAQKGHDIDFANIHYHNEHIYR